VLGTAAYMAPEQARGKPVDRRADIWAFGVVLFEMLAGKRVFAGETVSDTLAAVLTREPDWSALPAVTPFAVRRLLRLCLARDPRQRLHDIADARLELETAEAGAEPALAAKAGGATRLAWAVAVVAGLVAAGALWTRAPEAGSPGPVLYVDVAYPRDVEPVASVSGWALSPDGRSVAVTGVRDGTRRLFLRSLDRPEAVEIPESQGVSSVTFSPDGGSLAYGVLGGGSALVRLSLADRERRRLTTGVDQTSSIAWGTSGIIFSRLGALWIVPAEGGEPRALTRLDPDRHEAVHLDPLVLPGGGIVLFSSLTAQPGSERIEAVSLRDARRWVVLERAITPVLSPTGHLLFGRDGAVLAVIFDPDSATVRGTAVPVIPPGVVETQRSGTLGLRLSPAGTLAFLPAGSEVNRVVSVGRDGAALSLDLPPARHANPRLSPDRHRLLFETGRFLEALDLARGTRAQLTKEAPGTSYPAWNTAGDRVVFRRLNSPFWMAADGSGREGPVPGTFTSDFPTGAGPDRDSMIIIRVQPETGGDIFLVSIDGKFEPRPLVATSAFEGGGHLLPDGRFLAYLSNESGQFEVYVRRYPALDRSWQVSEGGGVQPRWSPSGREIFYRNGRNMMAVAFDASGPDPKFGKPQPLFVDEYDFGQSITIANYDVTADGRFIMLRREPHGSPLRAVLNWTEELKRTLASGGGR